MTRRITYKRSVHIEKTGGTCQSVGPIDISFIHIASKVIDPWAAGMVTDEVMPVECWVGAGPPL